MSAEETKEKLLAQLNEMLRHTDILVRNCLSAEARNLNLRERPRKQYWRKMLARGINTKKWNRLERRGETATRARMYAEGYRDQLVGQIKRTQEEKAA